MNYQITLPSKKQTITLLVLLLLIMLSINNAYATVSNNTMDTIVDTYKAKSIHWEQTLAGYAKSLFWLLAGIEFSWMGIQMVLKGADLMEWIAKVVNQILFIGFFYALLLNSAEWARAIISSFVSAATSANASAGASGGITPSNVFDLGLDLGIKVLGSLSLWSPAYSAGLVIAALVIVVCFALITAAMVQALIEAYVIISAGVLLMGFGGSRWTKDYAIKTITYAVSVGAKLFVLQLLIGLGESMLTDWSSNFQNQDADIFVVVGSAVVMLSLTRSIPSIIQGLINGHSVGHGGELMGAAGAMMGAAGGAIGAALGAGSAVNSAMGLAKTQNAAESAAGGATTSSTFSKAMKNLGSAAAGDVGRRLSGRAHHGTMGGRMAEAMGQQQKELKTEMEKPVSDENSTGGNNEQNIIR